VGSWEGALCPACVQAGTSPEGLDGASTETIQEKNSRVLQELSDEVDQLKGSEGSSQHALVELAHIKKQKILHSGPPLQGIKLNQKLTSASSALLHAKYQDPAVHQFKVSCGDHKLGVFEQFNPDSARSIVVQKAFQFGDFKYISSPARCIQVSNEQEAELQVESLHSDLQGMHPVQFHMALTYSEMLEFTSSKSIPTERGDYYNFNIFTSLEDALQFHAYITRDFKVNKTSDLLTSHDLYFVSFWMEDRNFTQAMNSGRFTTFNRSGHSRMLKVSKPYFMSASEIRLHEVSTMHFCPAAYWSGVQKTSWSDFHVIFNAVFHEYDAKGAWTQYLNLPWGWHHLQTQGLNPSQMTIQEKA
jgi:hypothetical protein